MMFDRSNSDLDLETFDHALPRRNGRTKELEMPNPLVRKKTLGRRVKFWALNAVVCPVLFILCMVVAAQGIRDLLPVMQMRLYRLPLPFMEMLRDYQGFSSMDLSHLASALLFIAVSLTWKSLVGEAKGEGSVVPLRKTMPPAFFLYSGIATIILVADAFVFYVGLASQANAWNETPFYVPVVCTVLYSAGVAAFAAFHYDYQTSDRI